MLISCKGREEIVKLKMLLNSEFEMKNLAHARKLLGMENGRNMSKGIMFLSQENCLRKVMDTFEMCNSKPLQLLLASHLQPTVSPNRRRKARHGQCTLCKCS